MNTWICELILLRLFYFRKNCYQASREQIQKSPLCFRVLVSFSSIHLSGSGFTEHLDTKKARNRLNTDIRLALTNSQPRILMLVVKMKS